MCDSPVRAGQVFGIQMDRCVSVDRNEDRVTVAAAQINLSEVVTKVGAMHQEQLKVHHQATLQMLTDFTEHFTELHQKQLQEQKSILETLDRKLDEQSHKSLRQAAITPVAIMPKPDGHAFPHRGHGEHDQLLGHEHKVGTSLHDKKADAALRKQYLGTVGWEKKTTQRSESALPELKQSKSGTQSENFGVKITPKDAVQHFFVKLVHNSVFVFVSAFLVVANSVMIGVQVDMDLRRAQKNQSPLEWESEVDLGFTTLFAVEIVLRICAERMVFFIGPAWKWNAFDCVVVGLGTIDILDVLNMNFTVFRILRVVRVVRILRVIRVFKVFRELRMMALSILSCLQSLIWAFTLLLLVMYVFTIVLLQGARDYLRGDDVDLKIKQQLYDWFTGVVYTLYTLLQAISGGNSWGDIASPFLGIDDTYGLLFTSFIIFIMFGLLNVLVGVFVQNTEAIANIDRDFVLQEEMNRKSSNINKLRELFNQVDVDGSGTISWKELKANLTDDAMKAYFAMMQIETEEAEGLFNLLDVDESGEVAIEEFIMGCMRLKGAAKSIDLASLLYENKRLHTMMNRYMSSLYHEIEIIQHAIMPQLFEEMPVPPHDENPNGA